MVRVPKEVEIIAKTIRPPICPKGIIEDNKSAPNPIFDQASKMNLINLVLFQYFFDSPSIRDDRPKYKFSVSQTKTCKNTQTFF